MVDKKQKMEQESSMDKENLIFLILEHLREAMSYLPAGMICGGVSAAGYVGVALAWGRGRKQSQGGSGLVRKGWLVFLSTTYVAVVLLLAFFSREPGSRTGVDLQLFATWGESAEAHAYVIENVLMLIPFGMLFPCLFRPLRKGWICTGVGCGLSVTLEFAQWLTQRGHCQLDDVVTNTLGAWIGWLIFRRLARRRPDIFLK